MIIGVFCRANHPDGYGQCQGTVKVPYPPPYDQHHVSKAHGYITVIVQCKDYIDLRVVRDKLSKHHYEPDPDHPGMNKPSMPVGYDPWKRGDNWYAGPYELVWTAEGYLNKGSELTMNAQPFPLGSLQSYGDNRATAYLAAEEVLEDDNSSS